MTAATSTPPPIDLEWAESATGSDITVAVRKRATARQQLCLDFIVSYTTEHGFPPTLREIGRHMGIRSTNGVNDHLRALERKGLLRRPSGGLSRALVPVEAPPKADSFAAAIGGWRSENTALTTLLRKVQAASSRLPTLTAEFVVLLGDIRDALSVEKGSPNE